MVEEIPGQTMKYDGKFSVLRQYPDKAYNTGEVSYLVEGPILSIPALPFVMVNLKENAKQISEHGWRFNCGTIKFFVPPEEIQTALSRYITELKHNPIERFLDPYNHE